MGIKVANKLLQQVREANSQPKAPNPIQRRTVQVKKIVEMN
jgi:hypothetical protein